MFFVFSWRIWLTLRPAAEHSNFALRHSVNVVDPKSAELCFRQLVFEFDNHFRCLSAFLTSVKVLLHKLVYSWDSISGCRCKLHTDSRRRVCYSGIRALWISRHEASAGAYWRYVWFVCRRHIVREGHGCCYESITRYILGHQNPKVKKYTPKKYKKPEKKQTN